MSKTQDVCVCVRERERERVRLLGRGAGPGVGPGGLCGGRPVRKDQCFLHTELAVG